MNGVLPARIALIPELLERAAADWPDRTALVCGERRIDYRRYAAEVRAAARRLRQALPPGARVATLLGNSDLACVLTLALQMAGCQHVPLNPLYTARELDFILRDAQPALLIADEASSALAAPLAAAQGIRLLDGAAARAWTIPSDETPAAAPAGDADAPALLQYTGGTTGQPKGVILSRAAIATNVFQREAVLPTRHGAETVLCAMPLFHSYGMAMGLFLAASAAATLVVLPRYRPDDVFDAVARERVTLFPGSPTIYAGLMAHARFAQTDWSSVRVCYSGSAPLAEETLRRWEAAVGAPIYEGYGQTEAGPILTYNGPQGSRAGSVGRPEFGRVHIVSEDGERELPPGQPGVIYFSGGGAFEYHKDPAKTRKAYNARGWATYGDIGYLDADGYLYLTDRLSNMIVSGGVNIYPQEAENLLCTHPAVADVAVIGVPDAEFGEAVKAVVQLREPSDAGPALAQALIDYCRARLSPIKCPKSVDFSADMPRTETGKLLKRLVKQRYWPAGEGIAR